MSTVFADASYYIALLSAGGQYAGPARKLASEHRGLWVTTTSVLTEVGNYLAHPSSRASFVGLVKSLQQSPRVLIVSSSPQLWQQCLDFYASRNDKSWSLTDCESLSRHAESTVDSGGDSRPSLPTGRL